MVQKGYFEILLRDNTFIIIKEKEREREKKNSVFLYNLGNQNIPIFHSLLFSIHDGIKNLESNKIKGEINNYINKKE